jgi:hypothetical protein
MADLDLPGTGGSDAHKVFNVGSFVTLFENKISGEEDFLREIGECRRGAPADLVFLAAQKKADLSKIRALARKMKRDGALWVVYPKGVTAIREMDVLAAGRAGGLKDVKVAGFSPALTALKFVIPLTAR